MNVPCDYRTAQKENYIIFKKKYPNIELDKNKWEEVVYGIAETFGEILLETGTKARINGRLGYFAVTKNKRRATKITRDGKDVIVLAVNWKRSKELGKKVYHLNNHTDGFYFKWKWFTETAGIKLCEFWYFKIGRKFARKLSAKILEHPDNQDIFREWKSY